MWAYVIRRLLLAVPTLVGASLIVFAMVHLAPGDPIAAVMPADSSPADIEAAKKALGFDKPLPVQYLMWLGRVARGDLGRSIATRRPVIDDVRDALGYSLALALTSSLSAFALASCCCHEASAELNASRDAARYTGDWIFPVLSA